MKGCPLSRSWSFCHSFLCASIRVCGRRVWGSCAKLASAGQWAPWDCLKVDLVSPLSSLSLNHLALVHLVTCNTREECAGASSSEMVHATQRLGAWGFLCMRSRFSRRAQAVQLLQSYFHRIQIQHRSSPGCNHSIHLFLSRASKVELNASTASGKGLLCIEIGMTCQVVTFGNWFLQDLLLYLRKSSLLGRTHLMEMSRQTSSQRRKQAGNQ